jgi:hypothetical protein
MFHFVSQSADEMICLSKCFLCPWLNEKEKSVNIADKYVHNLGNEVCFM